MIFVPARQCPKQVATPTCEGDNEAGAKINPPKPGSGNSCYPKLGGDEDAAAGAVDETFFILWKKRGRVRIGDGTATWLYRTADNRVKKAMTKKARYAAGIDGNEESDRTAALAESDVYFRSDAPEDDAVEKVRDALPAEYRELFRMRFMEKMTLFDVSEATGLPYSTLRRRIARMTLVVREIVGEMYRDCDIGSGQ